MEEAEANNITVSVICIAYNHEAFIKDALEGFVMQKTNFPFEIIVHDDASTDKTPDIIRTYETKYPGLFFNIFQTENQYSKGKGDLDKIVFNTARGKYIAICEGDDYWTDPNKLQKQVDFLEANPGFIMHSHRYLTIDNHGQTFGLSKIRYDEVDLDDFLTGRADYAAKTCTWIFRNDKQFLSELKGLSYTNDTILYVKLLSSGSKAKFSDEVMAAYRYHNGGVWSSLNEELKTEHSIETILTMIGLCKLNKYHYNLYFRLINANIRLINILNETSKKKKLLKDAYKILFYKSITSIDDVFSISFLKKWIMLLIRLIVYTFRLQNNTVDSNTNN